MTTTEKELPLTEHLRELRQRLIKAFAFIIAGIVISYFFINEIFNFFSFPILSVMPQGKTLIFTSFPEAFIVYLKLAIVCGLMLSSPFWIYEMWLFIVPGLYAHEKKIVSLVSLISSVFFVAGALFGYFIVFPPAFKFLSQYGGDKITLMPSVSEYFDFMIRSLLGFGIAFLLPVVIGICGYLGILSVDMLKNGRKYAVIIILVIAALLTPTPDVINQFMLAVPLYVLYEFSIIAVYFLGKTNKSGVVSNPEENL